MKRVFDRSGERAAEEVLRGEERDGERHRFRRGFPAGDGSAGTRREKRLFIHPLERLLQRARAQTQTVAQRVPQADHHARAPEQGGDPPRRLQNARLALEEKGERGRGRPRRFFGDETNQAAREVERDGLEVVQHVEPRVLVIEQRPEDGGAEPHRDGLVRQRGRLERLDSSLRPSRLVVETLRDVAARGRDAVRKPLRGRGRSAVRAGARFVVCLRRLRHEETPDDHGGGRLPLRRRVDIAPLLGRHRARHRGRTAPRDAPSTTRAQPRARGCGRRGGHRRACRAHQARARVRSPRSWTGAALIRSYVWTIVVVTIHFLQKAPSLASLVSCA